MRRRPGLFLPAVAILTLVALLLCFLGGLLDGLISSSTAAYRAQDADLIVFSDSSQDSLVRSRITPDVRTEVEAVDGVGRVGGLGVVQLGARVPGNAERDLADVALFGYEIAPDGVPDPPAAGEAYADDVLEAQGVEVDDELLVGPSRTPVTVVGFVSDTTYVGQGSLWAAPETWTDALTANRPDAQLNDGTFQALVVQVDRGADAAAVGRAIDESTGSTSALTPTAAAEALGGVSEQRTTFNQIIGITVLISVVVVALFFALLTVERTGLYGVLKAIGARSRTLFGGLVVQALVVTGIAALLGGAVAVLFQVLIPPGTIPFDLTPGRVVASTVLLLVAAVVGCAFSLRRVVRIDPASAIGSAL